MSASLVPVLASLLQTGHSCGVTPVQASRINIAGVKALCQTEFCFLCETRDIFKSSNVLRLTQELFNSLEEKTSSGYSCGITTKVLSEPEKLAVQADTACRGDVCLRCR